MGFGGETAGNPARDSLSRFARLSGYLDQDPGNLSLLADAADAAFEEGALNEAAALIARHRDAAPLPLPLVNLEGLVALRRGDLAGAGQAFDAVIAGGVRDPSVRFNRAWVHALAGEHDAVLAMLDDEVLAASPRAPALRVQALHHVGRIDEALNDGQALANRFPDNDALLGALSVAAMDADDYDLARHFAETAGGGADALTTRGLVALNDGNPDKAMALFDAALAEHRDAPRALLGKGLGLIASGKVAEGSAALRRGAEIFGDHLGSWIGVGWAQFIGKDLHGARATFEHALSLDENFAESHGGLAVLDIAEGDLESGARRADIALRLDRGCFGGMLAKFLLAEAKGDAAVAQRIWDRAMQAEAGPGGKTLAQAMIGFGLDPSRGRGAA